MFIEYDICLARNISFIVLYILFFICAFKPNGHIQWIVNVE